MQAGGRAQRAGGFSTFAQASHDLTFACTSTVQERSNGSLPASIPGTGQKGRRHLARRRHARISPETRIRRPRRDMVATSARRTRRRLRPKTSPPNQPATPAHELPRLRAMAGGELCAGRDLPPAPKHPPACPPLHGRPRTLRWCGHHCWPRVLRGPLARPSRRVRARSRVPVAVSGPAPAA